MSMNKFDYFHGEIILEVPKDKQKWVDDICKYGDELLEENQRLREALKKIRELEKKTLPINGLYIEIIYAALEGKDAENTGLISAKLEGKDG